MSLTKQIVEDIIAQISLIDGTNSWLTKIGLNVFWGRAQYAEYGQDYTVIYIEKEVTSINLNFEHRMRMLVDCFIYGLDELAQNRMAIGATTVAVETDLLKAIGLAHGVVPHIASYSAMPPLEIEAAGKVAMKISFEFLIVYRTNRWEN